MLSKKKIENERNFMKSKDKIIKQKNVEKRDSEKSKITNYKNAKTFTFKGFISNQHRKKYKNS